MPNAILRHACLHQDRRARLTTSTLHCCLRIPAACDIGCLAKGQMIVAYAYPAICKFQVPSLVNAFELESAD